MVGMLLIWSCVCFVFVCLFVAFLFLLLDWKSKMMATARQSFNIIHNEKNIFKFFFSESKLGRYVPSTDFYETQLSVYRKSKMVTTMGKLFTEKNI
jgi:Ca2+/Na+ antiporter